MKQLISPRPFLEIIARPRPALTGRWAHLQPGINAPKLSLNAVNTIAHLLDGSAKISYFVAGDPAIRVEMAGPDGQPNKYLYRLRSNQIYTTTPFSQDVESLILFAIRLLIHRDTNFSLSYFRLLREIAAGRPQEKLDKAMVVAVANLLQACQDNFAMDEALTDVVWFYAVRMSGLEPITEMSSDQGILGLTEILSDAGKFAQYWDGEINLPSKLRVAF
jgi:hypothetical protein